MKKLQVRLQNCHGIKNLDATIDFNKNSAVAVYAPNGTMKTSLAHTFQDLSNGNASIDKMFPERVTKREINDENDIPIKPEDVVVILSYDEELEPSEATSTLLVNAKLRKEYEELQADLMAASDELLVALKSQANTKQDALKRISQVFTGSADDTFKALSQVHDEIVAEEGSDLSTVPYDLIFNEKVMALLDRPEFKDALAEYVTRLNDLLDDSLIFSRESFSFYNAANVTKSLDENGFFSAGHVINLHASDGNEFEVTDSKAFDSLISNEKKRISEDPELNKKLQVIEAALNRNIEARNFHAYIADHTDLLPELISLEPFEKSLWKSYLKSQITLYERVVNKYQAAESRKQEIEAKAAEEGTQWEQVIRIFNERFTVPFRLSAKNRNEVVLGKDRVLDLAFDFEDGPQHATVGKDALLKALSNGEKKALYILNVLFEVEARKFSDTETLFIIDDIADSFDYKNKYAIIHYLQEMVELPNFRLLILTHNFDFFRTLESRKVAMYKNCLIAQRYEDRVILARAEGIRNPFVNDFKPNFFTDGMKRVASIPFIRNIVEYTKGVDSPDYQALTSLLHWKSETTNMSQQALDGLFHGVFSDSGNWPNLDGPVVEMVFEQAEVAITAPEGINFENKIVLSIAIRLRAEKYMLEKLGNVDQADSIESNQTQALLALFRSSKYCTPEARKVLDSVALMTPENLHINSFMYEPIIDMSDAHLRKLYADVSTLT